MNIRLKYIALAFSLFLLSPILPAYSLEVPELKARVNDYAGILSEQAKQELETKLKQIETTDSTQIAVLTIASLEGDAIEEFSIRVADKWKIGQTKKDNGVILIIAKNDRRMRIEVGYGLEGKLTDLMSGRIIANVIKPAFQAGDFDSGIIQGVDAIVAAVRGEFKAEDSRLSRNGKRASGKFLYLIIFGLFFISIIGSIKKILGGAVGAVILPIIGLFLFPIGLWLLLLIPLGFGLGFILPVLFGSSRGMFYGGHGGGFSSGSFGGGGFGGGFGGGGGSFGGGGASGSW